MKLVKFIIIVLCLIFLGISGGWYFITNKIANDLNSKYAKQKFSVNGIDKSDYFITCSSIEPSGFPYKIAWSIKGWQEESKGSQIIYKSPIKFGYDLLTQKVFVSYDGDIVAYYKPSKNGFGSLLRVSNYTISTYLPLSMKLFETLKSMNDPAEIINYIKEVIISTNKVEIFDLVDNEKFYEKEYEFMQVNFAHSKVYKNFQDLLDNIPSQYHITYEVKTKPNDKRMRMLPVSLFYGFSAVPNDVTIKAKTEIKTDGKNFQDFKKGLEIKSEISSSSTYLDLSNLTIYYKSGNNSDTRDYRINIESNIKTKTGLFDEVFKKYELYAKDYINTQVSKIIDNEIRYIIHNKELFRFKDLENSNYNFILKMLSENRASKSYLKIEDLSILSDKSGVRLKHDMESRQNNKRDWIANGILYINNYPAVIEFMSGYIYRFGKFRFLNDEARELYVDVNKAFLKDISDYPKSDSSDLSFKYSIDSRSFASGEFGSVIFSQIPELYTLMIYKKLIDKVGGNGDVLAKMRNILPGIDANEQLLNKILPNLSGSTINKTLQKPLDKILPDKTKKTIEKIIPKGDIGKILLNNFGK